MLRIEIWPPDGSIKLVQTSASLLGGKPAEQTVTHTCIKYFGNMRCLSGNKFGGMDRQKFMQVYSVFKTIQRRQSNPCSANCWSHGMMTMLRHRPPPFQGSWLPDSLHWNGGGRSQTKHLAAANLVWWTCAAPTGKAEGSHCNFLRGGCSLLLSSLLVVSRCLPFAYNLRPVILTPPQ